jgi:probable phosphoglycerate mutase
MEKNGMAQKTELWLVRHGETEWTISGQHTGTSDIPLTARGRERAQGIRDYLRHREFKKVFVSPLGRARETCAIAGYGDQAEIDPNLTEWNYGDFEGKTTPEIREQYPDWLIWNGPVPNGESVQQVGARTDKVIARALAEIGEDGGRVALFAHGHVLRILTARWLGLAPDGGRFFALGTGSVSVLGFERDQRVIEAWNRSFEVDR